MGGLLGADDDTACWRPLGSRPPGRDLLTQPAYFVSQIPGCRIPSIEFLEPSPELAYIIGVVAGDG
ncbi:MAG: hypothetical protein QXT92_03590 [Nitrososphaerota archaeon]